jgi:hypothetical protein
MVKLLESTLFSPEPPQTWHAFMRTGRIHSCFRGSKITSDRTSAYSFDCEYSPHDVFIFGGALSKYGGVRRQAESHQYGRGCPGDTWLREANSVYVAGSRVLFTRVREHKGDAISSTGILLNASRHTPSRIAFSGHAPGWRYGWSNHGRNVCGSETHGRMVCGTV